MTAQHPLDEAAAFLDRIRGARILCVGDAMLDCTVEGGVERVSPEAPIPVLRMESERTVLGGAANVVANLASLGARAELVAVVGADREGDALETLLAERASAALVRAADRPTIVKTRYVAGNQQLLRVDRERGGRLDAAVLAALRDRALHALGAADALILSDYGKGVVDGALTVPLIEAARRSGKPVLVDPKGRDYARYRGATVVTPNRSELVTASGGDLADDEAVAAAAERLRAGIAVDWLLTTLGGAGMLLAGADGRTRIPGVRREVYDVVGAGDTVLATMAALVAAGCGVPSAAWLANLAGSVVVGRRGTATVSDSDLRNALAEQRGTQHESKILGREAAIRLVGEARQRGRRIGFTNGCFDILHPGHVSLIAQARLRCDVLVVGLNSDASVRRLKGPERPVNDERARAHVLAALSGVDAVVIFDEDTPLELIRALRPDLLVKGADYTRDQVVGGADVRAWGGEVYLAELMPGRSTTATIARIGKGS
ncbi:MAG: D-glycero-beta-D-manno-heptose 1-phosphate adenylyltransferase [Geminicoccaceae bacterium]